MSIENVALTAEWLTSYVFCFETGAERRRRSSHFLFERDGSIGGKHHANESRSRLDQGEVVIMRPDGTETCRARMAADSNGKVELSGRFLLTEDPVAHYFRPLEDRRISTTVQSFDLFDTLVARYCFLPAMVFKRVEEKARAAGFAELRRRTESRLWRSGDYVFDDIYEGIKIETGWSDDLIARLKILELSEEWDNLFPIKETISRVHPGDIIISDMYLPFPFIKGIVQRKCGLSEIEIFLTSHGKHRGTIWPKLKERYKIAHHFGDNHHSDVAQPQSAGIIASHVTLYKWSQGEETLNAIGLTEISRAIRKARLSTFEFSKTVRRAQLIQFDVNIPFLIISGLLLLRHAEEKGIDTILMCGRDSAHWIRIVNWLISLSKYKPKITYFPSSRVLFLSKEGDYIPYFHSLRGTRTLIADLSGTGRTPATFIARASAQSDASVFLVLKSESVAGAMEAKAPARDDVSVERALSVRPSARIVFEKFNATFELRAIGVRFNGCTFDVLREETRLSDEQEYLIKSMSDAFSVGLEHLKHIQTNEIADNIDTDSLRLALDQLVKHSHIHADFVGTLPD